MEQNNRLEAAGSGLKNALGPEKGDEGFGKITD